MNIIDSINITHEASAQWKELCRRYAKFVKGPVGMEEIRENSDGTVTIYVPGVAGLELTLENDQWCWAN